MANGEVVVGVDVSLAQLDVAQCRGNTGVARLGETKSKI